ncbi:related to ribosomal assembly complex component Ipi3 [Ramularia collo-cygni]|uniref:Pre-rRNA-processing protein IPI3 n=1 Tax=Ramularia collo-cygni TaxID=112498 RepID=A0A2D3UMA7_9PEZI|nr:related to ribosomal assembly complex component Ipi3 [Ramularia collo-cygni]CZT15041.1 related to ribosomal assembly complex component Ipi3 [Ramularia collo-cygni]
MLTEHFIASIGVPAKAPGPNVPKDAAIFLHEFQPLSAQRSLYKKSATLPNCLAVSESHVFAAQADKAVVHVYNREKGNHEATVPFTERIGSITLACDDTVLIIGTVEGRIFLWETCTGRQVTTNQAHLQPVTGLVVDARSNFLLSASKDSTIHVWSLPALLSFSNANGVAPLRTFSLHRSEVTSIVLGHSVSNCNFAVSTSKDKSCMIWDYHTGNLIRTYLLPGVPLCTALDPADRAAYVGYEDGSLQQLDLFASQDSIIDAVQNGGNPTEPVQPPASSRWKLPESSHGSALSLSVSFDGSTLISGHKSGTILSWDVARGSFVAAQTQLPLPGPLNNLQFLPVTGFNRDSLCKRTKISDVVKPKFGAFDSADTDAVPGNYTLSVRFPSDLASAPGSEQSSFMASLTAPCFPDALLDEGLCELASWGKTGGVQMNGQKEEADGDFIALNEAPAASGTSSLHDENASLRLQIEALRRVQKKSLEKMEKLSDEKAALQKREQQRQAKRGVKQPNGAASEDDESERSSDEDSSSGEESSD